MSDEAAFLAAIRADRHDDTARLVYADWLEERGDGRAEFLRLQHQLALILGRLNEMRSVLDREWVQAVEVSRGGGQQSRLEGLRMTEIEVNQFLGFGPIPDFRFTARSDGRYSYDGRRHIEPLGERSGRFPPFLFARLAELSFDLDILGLDDTYPFSVDDLPITIVTIRHASGVKVIRNEAANSCPLRLWAFVALIEHAMRVAFEIEDRQR